MNDTVMVCVRQGFRGLKPDLGDPAEKGGAAGRFERRKSVVIIVVTDE